MPQFLLELDLAGPQLDQARLVGSLEAVLQAGLAALRASPQTPRHAELPQEILLARLRRVLFTGYPLADTPRPTELLPLFGVARVVELPPGYHNQVRAVATGEWRAPRAGEWFLSGAIVEAYQALHDFLSVYPIARLVRTRTLSVTVLEPPDPEEP